MLSYFFLHYKYRAHLQNFKKLIISNSPIKGFNG